MNNVVFEKDFFINNRQRLRELFIGKAPIVITANGLYQKNGTEAMVFVQDSNFWYLTGIDIPDVILVIDKNKEYLIVPKYSEIHEYFDGKISYSNLTNISGIGDCFTEDEGWKLLKNRVKKTKHIATLAPPPSYIKNYGIYTNPARKNLVNKIKHINPTIELLDLRMHLSNMRMIKQEVEITAINSAIDVTIDSLKHIINSIRKSKYDYEYEIEADITRGFRKTGSEGHGFDPIVGSGQNSTIIHYNLNNAKLETNKPIVIDIGAKANHYVADISRTVVHGKPTKRLKTVYEAVVAAQDHALSLLKPGTILSDYEKEMEHYIGEKLREIGLIKIIDSDSVRKYFPHLVSHYLGLDVHDVGDYSRPLEKNMIITCEPGIYIPEEGIGVRIEDDILITDTGNEILTKRLPRAI